ncbi:MAG: hypothetical protein R3F59_22385 [Myxococcota bacterium]
MSVHPQFVGAGALAEYMQVNATGTSTVSLPAEQPVLFPIAGENLAGELYEEVCIHGVARARGQHRDGAAVRAAGHEPSLRPYEKVWRACSYDQAGQQCLRFSQGTIVDPVSNAHFYDWETAPGVVEPVLVVQWGEVLWKGIVASSGAGAVASVPNNAVRSLGASGSVAGPAMRGFTLPAGGFPAIAAAADLGNYTGPVPVIGLRRTYF